MKKAIISLSGGLDSTTCLGWAINKGYKCYCVFFDYGQRHLREIESARKVAKYYKLPIDIIKLNFPWLKKSSLIDTKKQLPDKEYKDILKGNIPSTYVPGRNLVFSSILISYADSIKADAVILGPNAIDYSGYPDCRPSFYRALSKAVKYGTEKSNIQIITPIINLSKKDIIRLAVKLKVPLHLTWSCYSGGKKPCGKCDSCKLRAKGFKDAGLVDPVLL